MIAYLKGTVTSKTNESLIVVNNDLGFEVMVPVALWRKTIISTPIELFTHEYIREDSRELYGFATVNELYFFRKLLTISGVGPRSALNLFSLGTLNEIQTAIANGNIAYLTAIPRVGTKIAQKIVLELKGKLDLAEGVSQEEQETLEALESLGYSRAQAREALRRVSGALTDVGDRVRAALKILGQKVR